MNEDLRYICFKFLAVISAAKNLKQMYLSISAAILENMQLSMQIGVLDAGTHFQLMLLVLLSILSHVKN